MCDDRPCVTVDFLAFSIIGIMASERPLTFINRLAVKPMSVEQDRKPILWIEDPGDMEYHIHLGQFRAMWITRMLSI